MKSKTLVFTITVLTVALLGGQIQASTCTIGWAKSLPDGTVLSSPIIGVVSTAVTLYGMGNVSYIQAQDKSGGIMVDSVGVAGQIVSVTGTVSSTLAGERYISNSVLAPTGSGQVIVPLGMNIKAAGSSEGLDNTGLMAQVTGSVTSLGYSPADFSNYAYLDDGSGLLDGTTNGGIPNKGIRVKGASNLQVGTTASFTGVIGKDLDGAQSIKLINERVSLTELSTPVAYAMGGNGQIYVYWDADPCASEYKIYKSETENGTYLSAGQSTEASFLDQPLVNEVTRWYKVAAMSGTIQGTSSLAVSATTTDAAPTVSITSLAIAEDGLLSITFDCAPGSGGSASSGRSSTATGSPIFMVSYDIDGVPIWNEAPTTANGTWCYDSSELPNGPHTVGISVYSDGYLGYTKNSFTLNNDISNFVLTEVADSVAPTPVQATLKVDCNWTATVKQGSNVLGTQSGTGRTIIWGWDNSTGVEGATEMEISYTPIPNGVPKSKLSTFWIAGRSLLATRNNYRWANWYANDQLIDFSGGSYIIGNFFKAKFYDPKFAGCGADANSKLTSTNDWETIVFERMQAGYPCKISHLVWSGHGNSPFTKFTSHPNGTQANAWYAKFVGEGENYSGVSPFIDYKTGYSYYIQETGDYGWSTTEMKALGPRLGNNAVWKRSGDGSGRIAITQMRRRLKFVFGNTCNSAKGGMPLALGIPKKIVPGCGSAFIGFNQQVWAEQASLFSMILCDNLKQGKTVGVAFEKASEIFTWISGPHANSQPTLYGDPNLKVGMNEL